MKVLNCAYRFSMVAEPVLRRLDSRSTPGIGSRKPTLREEDSRRVSGQGQGGDLRSHRLENGDSCHLEECDLSRESIDGKEDRAGNPVPRTCLEAENKQRGDGLRPMKICGNSSVDVRNPNIDESATLCFVGRDIAQDWACKDKDCSPRRDEETRRRCLDAMDFRKLTCGMRMLLCSL